VGETKSVIVWKKNGDGGNLERGPFALGAFDERPSLPARYDGAVPLTQW